VAGRGEGSANPRSCSNVRNAKKKRHSAAQSGTKSAPRLLIILHVRLLNFDLHFEHHFLTNVIPPLIIPVKSRETLITARNRASAYHVDSCGQLLHPLACLVVVAARRRGLLVPRLCRRPRRRSPMPLAQAVGVGAVGVVNRRVNRREVVAALCRLASALFVSLSPFLDLERRLEFRANGGIAVP